MGLVAIKTPGSLTSPLKTMSKKIKIYIIAIILLLIPTHSIGIDDHPTGFFGWHSVNETTGKVNGIMIYVVKTNLGPHVIMQCDDGVPLVRKLEGKAPEYHFSIDDAGSSKCYETDYVLRLSEDSAGLWVDKDKKVM